MNRFIKELRRREVFRTAGLYVGICWILIEVGSVILPVFDAPEWLFRGTIIAAVVGFPFMLVLAWFFDVNKDGISLQADPTDTTVGQLGARKSDFAIIGVLVLALIVSLALNIRNQSPIVVILEPVPVLVNRFDNTTGDPLFDHVVKRALITGVEVAPHVAAFEAGETTQTARQTRPGDVSAGRATSYRNVQRDNVELLLSGSVDQSGNEYRITVDGIDATNDQSVFTLSGKADSRDTVLAAISKLATKVRKELGDKTVGNEGSEYIKTFTAESLQAASAYASAIESERVGNLEDAARFFEQAIAADSKLGRAFSRLAFVEFELGKADEGAGHWAQALTLKNTMTEREWLRYLGRYQASVALDDDTAVSTYAELVEKYPADTDARERYATTAFNQLDFATAIRQTREILEIFPGDLRRRLRLAIYQMYAGDWESAADNAAEVLATDPDLGTAYLPIAMAALASKNAEASRDAYQRMAETTNTVHDASAATLGLADIDLYFGDVSAAQERLQSRIKAGTEREDQRMTALKYIALAHSYAEQENFSAATTAVERALSLASGNASSVPAAMIYLQAGDEASARAIADALTERADSHSRAFGKMLTGMILEREGAATQAILTMRDATATADLWLIRYELAKAYLRAGNFPEALGELTTLQQRAGEATSVFLDDMPTYRVMAELPYWLGRVQESLNTPTAAQASYERYLALRPEGGALAQDASERVARLQ